MVAGDEETARAAEAAGVPHIRPDCGPTPCLRPQFAAAAAILALGADVLLVAHGVELRGRGGVENMHSTDVQCPPPPYAPRVCMNIHPEEKEETLYHKGQQKQ